MKLLTVVCLMAASVVAQQLPAGSENAGAWSLTAPGGAAAGTVSVSSGGPIGVWWFPDYWLIPASGFSVAPGEYVWQQTMMLQSTTEYVVSWACDNSCRLYDNGVEVAVNVPDMDSLPSIISTFQSPRMVRVMLYPGAHVLQVKVKNFGPDASPVGFYMRWAVTGCGR